MKMNSSQNNNIPSLPIFPQADDAAEGLVNDYSDLLFNMEEDLGGDNPTLQPVPIALTQDPAPVDLDMMISQDENQARTTAVKKIKPTDYALLKALDMKKRRSISEVKNCFSDKVNQDVRLDDCIQSSPHNTEGAKDCREPVEDQSQDIIATENKNLKQQIAQLQNVIVSMCVLNQRQQSVRSSTSMKDSRSRSGKATAKSRSLSNGLLTSQAQNNIIVAGNQSGGRLHQRRNTTGTATKVEIISQSIQKQIEPHPESLMIEPSVRPALLSTIPPDWLAVEQQPPQFRHTISPDGSDMEIASSSDSQNINQNGQRVPKHERRYSHQGLFGHPRASADYLLNANYLTNGEFENQQIQMPQYCQTNKAAALQQILFSVNNAVEHQYIEDDEGVVDLNDAEIEVRPENMQIRQENTTSSSVSLNRRSGQRGRNQQPRFMQKTVSSQAKQVQKNSNTLSSASSTSSTQRQQNNLSNYATRYTSSRRQGRSTAIKHQHNSSMMVSKTSKNSKNIQQQETSSSLARSEQQIFFPNVHSDDSNAEVSICAVSDAPDSSHKPIQYQMSHSLSINNGPYDDQLLTTPEIISQEQQIVSSATKITSKIRQQRTSTNKKQNQKQATIAKRQEFRDLTKKQNSRLSQQNSQQTTIVLATSNTRTTKLRKSSTMVGKNQLKDKQDRRLFQKTMDAIQSDQHMRNLKQDLKFKKQIGSDNMANSSMSKEDLAKVLYDATSASLNSGHKLNSSSLHNMAQKKHQSNRVIMTDPQLTSPAMVSQKIILSGNDGTMDHIEGEMPNTGKQILFDSDEKRPQALAMREEDATIFSDSQENNAVEQMLLDQMANQSPLKSGPSTVQGTSVYESPNKSYGPTDLSSSMKKIIVPPLNFEKVFEQQRLILEQEDLRKKEEDKKQLLLLQQQKKAQAFQNSASSKKKHIKSQQHHSHSKKKQKKSISSHKKQKLLNSSASAKFEESPQSKCSYNIGEETQNIVHVYGSQQPIINAFETIVKVDKKTEEKLMRSSIEISANKQVKKSGSKHLQASSNVVETPDEPISAPPQALQAPSKPEEQHIKLLKINQKPMKFTMNKSLATVPRRESKTSVHTPNKAHSQDKLITSVPQIVKLQKKHSVTRPISTQKPTHEVQILSRNSNLISKSNTTPTDKKCLQTKHTKSGSTSAAFRCGGSTIQTNTLNLFQTASNTLQSHTTNVTPKSRNYGKHVPSQQTQQTRLTMVTSSSDNNPSGKKEKISSIFTGSKQQKGKRQQIQNHSSLNHNQVTMIKASHSIYQKQESAKEAGKNSPVKRQLSKTMPDEQNNKYNSLQMQDYSRVKTNLEKTQNLLDSFEPKIAGGPQGGKRSQSRIFIDELLMQPILKQNMTGSKVRPVSIVPYVAPSSDLIFMDQPRLCPFSPNSDNSTGVNNNMKTRTTKQVKDNHSRFVQARSSNRVVTSGSKNIVGRRQQKRHSSIVQAPAPIQQYQVVIPQITAFDNADICDIDKQLSLSVKVPVQAPSILRKTKNTTPMTTTDTTNSSSGLGLVQNNSQSSSGCFIQSTIIPSNISGKNTSMRSRQASSNNSRSTGGVFGLGGANNRIAQTDTQSSLFKKRSGILQRQASAINQVEQKGLRAWKI